MSLANFMAALANVNVPGVRNLSHPPTSLNDADLPTKWVQLPGKTVSVLTYTHVMYSPECRAQVVVALQPVAQGKQAENFANAIAMIDTLTDALQSMRILRRIEMRVAVVSVAQADYWSVIADVVM